MQRISFESSKPWTHFDHGSNRSGGFVEFNKSIHFINNLPDVVYVRDRSDLLTEIPPSKLQQSHTPDELLVRASIACSIDNKNNFIKQCRSEDLDNLNVVQIAVKNQWNNNRNYAPREDLLFECSVSMTEFKRSDGVIYLEDFDVVVFYGPYAKEQALAQFHPYSTRGAALQFWQEVGKDLNDNDFNFTISIIDNTGSVGPRWAKIGSESVEIIPKKDPHKRDGFYVAYRAPASAGMVNIPHSLVSHYTLEKEHEIPYFKFYRSKAEANAAPETLALEELRTKKIDAEARFTEANIKLSKTQNELSLVKERHQHELIKLEMENQRLAEERQLWIQKYNTEVEKQKAEQVKQKAEQARQQAEKSKALLEETVNRRKNISELIKYVPLLIGFALAFSAKK